MSLEKLSEELIKCLKLEGLEQISKKDIKKSQFIFIDMGEIGVRYRSEIKQGDSYTAYLAGSDSRNYLERVGIEGSSITPIPSDSTHYFLGHRTKIENLSSRHSNDSYSYDQIPIIFLKK